MTRTCDDPTRSEKTARRAAWWTALAQTSVTLLLSAGCGAKTPPPPPPCDQKCMDGVALRALRETMKFTFNKTLQGKDVGTHDETTDEFLRGSARVLGDATSNAAQGTTRVDLTYVFSQATYFQKNDEPKGNFLMALEGTIIQKGTIAVQPSSPTSLIMKSDAMTLVGKVYDPPLDYVEVDCPIAINQNGNNVSGMLCGREAGFSF